MVTLSCNTSHLKWSKSNNLQLYKLPDVEYKDLRANGWLYTENSEMRKMDKIGTMLPLPPLINIRIFTLQVDFIPYISVNIWDIITKLRERIVLAILPKMGEVGLWITPFVEYCIYWFYSSLIQLSTTNISGMVHVTFKKITWKSFSFFTF